MDEVATLLALGRQQLAAGDAMLATRSIERALSLEPASADVLCDLAVARHVAGDPEAAIAVCQRALALEPGHDAARLNLSCIMRELDRLEEAAFHAERMAMLAQSAGNAPLAADARFNRALALLGLGRLAEAWPDYDARLTLPPWARFDSTQRWRGEPLSGRRLVVRREQGVGDELVFAACYPGLLDRADGGTIKIECDARLAGPLARALPKASFHPIDTVAGRAAVEAGLKLPAEAARAPAEDLWVAAGSLPGLVGLPKHTQSGASLLNPLPELASRWCERLKALPGAGPLVGLCWRTSLSSKRRDRLQAPLEELAPLLALKDARFVNLQIGASADETARLSALAGRPVATFADLDLANDLEQAIALVAALDLVVSVGTWIVPLAGAAGTRAWYLAALRDYWTFGGGTIPWFAKTRVYRARDGYVAAASKVARNIAAGDWR